MMTEDQLALINLTKTGEALVQAINSAELDEEEKHYLVILHGIICETLRNIESVSVEH